MTGKCIECPFHGWHYDGETGQCTKIPYSNGKIPSQAKVKVWPSLEVNDLILVWHDAEGRDPNWFPEAYEQIKSKRWTYRGYTTHFINAHIEVSERFISICLCVCLCLCVCSVVCNFVVCVFVCVCVCGCVCTLCMYMHAHT